MTARAHAKYSPERDAVSVAVLLESPGARQIFQWALPDLKLIDDQAAPVEDPADWLHLREDVARSIYEALAEYFGHSGHDTRTLRRDYEAERQRVDTFIAHLTRT